MAERMRQPRKGFWFDNEMSISFAEQRAKVRKSESGELLDSDSDTIGGSLHDLDDLESSTS